MVVLDECVYATSQCSNERITSHAARPCGSSRKLGTHLRLCYHGAARSSLRVTLSSYVPSGFRRCLLNQMWSCVRARHRECDAIIICIEPRTPRQSIATVREVKRWRFRERYKRVALKCHANNFLVFDSNHTHLLNFLSQSMDLVLNLVYYLMPSSAL